MRLTDANNLILWLNDVWYSSFMYEESPTSIAVKDVMKAVEEYIKDAPTIDAVEVVRCRNCEWWICNPNTKNYGVCKKVSYDDFEVVMESDDFCSYGARREDGE